MDNSNRAIVLVGWKFTGKELFQAWNLADDPDPIETFWEIIDELVAENQCWYTYEDSENYPLMEMPFYLGNMWLISHETVTSIYSVMTQQAHDVFANSKRYTHGIYVNARPEIYFFS